MADSRDNIKMVPRRIRFFGWLLGGLGVIFAATAIVVFRNGMTRDIDQHLRTDARQLLDRCDGIQYIETFSDDVVEDNRRILRTYPEFPEIDRLLRTSLERQAAPRGFYETNHCLRFVTQGEYSDIELFLDSSGSIFITEIGNSEFGLHCPLASIEYSQLLKQLGLVVERNANSMLFFPTGERRAIGSFNRGVPTGEWTIFRRDGTKESSGLFVRGEKSGTWRFWDEEGVESSTEYGNRGQPKDRRVPHGRVQPAPPARQNTP